MPPPRYRFAEFTLSPARRALFRSGREVPLIPRYLDLLLLLVEKRSVALHRQEILDRVWADVVVSDGALSQAVRTLRRTLGEGGERVFVRTVSRHGYQFVCPVAEDADDGEAPVPEAGVPAPARDATDPQAKALARLLDPEAEEDVRREAAEELHSLGTAEALRRLDRAPGHARAWAHLRDSRWDVAGAGSVPLLAPPAGPAAWAALVGLRLRRALRLRRIALGLRLRRRSRGGRAGGPARRPRDGGARRERRAVAPRRARPRGRGRGRRGCGRRRQRARRGRSARALLADAGPRRARRRRAGPWSGRSRSRVAVGLLEALFGLDGRRHRRRPRGAGAWAPRPGSASASPRGGSREASRRPGAERGRGRSPPPPLACALAAARRVRRRGAPRRGEPRRHRGAICREPGRARPARPPVWRGSGSGPGRAPPSGFGEGLLFGAGLAVGLTRRPRRRSDG